MAYSKNTGGAPLNMLEMAFKKMLPHVKDDIIKEALTSFNVNNPRDIISKSDFETVFTVV